jgi:hypothetical protein
VCHKLPHSTAERRARPHTPPSPGSPCSLGRCNETETKRTPCSSWSASCAACRAAACSRRRSSAETGPGVASPSRHACAARMMMMIMQQGGWGTQQAHAHQAGGHTSWCGGRPAPRRLLPSSAVAASSQARCAGAALPRQPGRPLLSRHDFNKPQQPPPQRTTPPPPPPHTHTHPEHTHYPSHPSHPQREGEHGAAAGSGGDADLAAVRLHQLLHQVEAQACTAVPPRGRHVDLGRWGWEAGLVCVARRGLDGELFVRRREAACGYGKVSAAPAFPPTHTKQTAPPP